MEFLFPRLSQYEVDAFINIFFVRGIVVLNSAYFLFVMDLDSFFILFTANILKGVLSIASPLPIFKTDPKFALIFLHITS